MSPLKKQAISPYTLRLIKQHIPYIVACALFAGIIMSIVPFQLKAYLKARSDLMKTNAEIKSLADRAQAIASYPTEDLESLVRSLNSLYPSDEDKFSIFNAIDNLQTVTGIQIDSYSSPFAGKSFREISIPVKAHTDLSSFRKFLQNHVFLSGRFITLTQISYDQEKQNLNFTAAFHNRRIDVNTKEAVQIDDRLIRQAQSIVSQVESAGFVLKSEQEGVDQLPGQYSTKENPFQ